jgi:DNA-binding transcriptional ArsR family regulator
MNDFDGVVRALSDGTRRRILIALRDEEHIHPFSGDRDERNRAIQLHHVHLPLSAENDLVAWNRDTGIVRRDDGFEAVGPILTALETRRNALPDDSPSEGGRVC